MPHISEAPVLQIARFYTGLYTFRNPLIVPIRQFGRRLIELYDAILSGQNMEITNLLTLKRRPGYLSYNSNNVSGVPLAFYSFKPSSFPGQVFPVVDTTTAVQYVPPGTTAPTSLVSKTTTAQTNFCGIGGYLYMGNPNFSQKWDGPNGPQGVTNWGISIGASSNITGPNTAGSGASGVGGTAWTNPNNIASPTNYATCTVTTSVAGASTATLLAETFAFSMSAGTTITGIQVQADQLQTSYTGNTTWTVFLLKAGNIVGVSKHTNFFGSGSSGTLSFGSPSDLWGASWTPNDINQTNFGFRIQATLLDHPSSVTFEVKNGRITIFGVGGPSVTTTTGSLTAQVGFQYQACYGNSISGHVSSPSAPSNLIKPNSQGVQISLTASTDPQVNQIRLFRTTDGGGALFFELPTSPYANSTANVTDNAADTTLQIANVCPAPHFNDPPPAGLVDPVWFAGRLWGHSGNLLYYASGGDVTLGSGQESWYPVFVFSLPTTITRKFPLPNGMLVVTTDDIYVVRGIDTASFTVTEFMRDIGMRSFNAGDSDSSNVYIYTTDRQMILLNANGVQSISGSISDVIANVDPSVAYVSIFRYTAKNTLLFLGDGTTNIYPYNLNQQAWCPVQVPNGGAQAIGTIEIQPGVHAFLRGKTNPGVTIAQRDLNTFSDEGAAYACNVVFGPIEFADSLTLAQVRDIVVKYASGQSNPTVSVLANEVSGEYQILNISSSEPPELSATPSQSFTANRYTWKSTTLPEILNFVQLQMSWPAAATADELYLWAIGGTQTTGGSSLGAPGQLPQLQGR